MGNFSFLDKSIYSDFLFENVKKEILFLSYPRISPIRLVTKIIKEKNGEKNDISKLVPK